MIKRYHIALVLMMLACAWQTHAAEVEPMGTHVHVSNAFRGFPLNKREELQADYLGAGVTITAGKRKRWEIDISHGALSVERTGFESASILSTRYYPRRGR